MPYKSTVICMYATVQYCSCDRRHTSGIDEAAVAPDSPDGCWLRPVANYCLDNVAIIVFCVCSILLTPPYKHFLNRFLHPGYSPATAAFALGRNRCWLEQR